MQWGVCCTAKAPLAQLLAFVAWYRHLGATHIWLHLDDADAISASVLNQLDRVEAVLCDDAYWADAGRRPDKQEPRQVYNMQRAYRATDLPVLAHVDVDEYLLPQRPISDILDDWSGDAPFLRVRPAEALHDPTLKDDIFTARQFRLPFPAGMVEERKWAVLGAYAALLPSNMLSHRAGKSLFRTGVAGLVPKIHAGSFGKDAPPLKLPTHPEIVVLHFHAQDRATWEAALPHRVTKGAYRFNPPLAAHLDGATADEIAAFYDATQVASPELIDALRGEGLLVEAKLNLRDKVEALPF
ncbi:glycosyltransferase family 2 protein [Thalassorhabdomicrobium marinisediminis]|uniref:Glycosyl transferase family 2 n=1 Tax=Thalassorhabdomicrobium marinisediminis TaxID=2170577 RepID=A0A2T7FW10_9RHOB|nr:glycosyltransferase family 2 protein [Thalassorhabdomicrobium marinisediminis]PVA06342.1 hypothetical protein DC363_10585 [Thalassorhabdomicrobium marinisediminis]